MLTPLVVSLLIAGSVAAQPPDPQWTAKGPPPDWPLPGKLTTTLAFGPTGKWQGPTDSLYRRAREILNRGEYRHAADLFREYQQKNPSSQYLASAMYWQAFALYRAGTDSDLRSADQLLVALREKSTKLAEDAEVKGLKVRIAGALAARGDADAARQLRESAGATADACDREDGEIRAEALSALVQSDPAGSLGALRKVLARRDECSAPLRRRAVYHLIRSGGAEATQIITEVAKSDPSSAVRGEAIGALAQMPGGAGLPLLEQLLNQSSEDAVIQPIVHALGRVSEGDITPAIRRLIERTDVSERVRSDAVMALVTPRGRVRAIRPVRRPGDSATVVESTEPRLSEANATFLKGLYERSQSPTIRRAIVEAMAFGRGPARDAWVIGLLRSPNTDARERNTLIAGLRRSEIAIDEVTKLYDALTDRESRSMLVGILGARTEPAATDKLVDIARRGTDPSIRREAIAALARKNDPRTTKLLLELVER